MISRSLTIIGSVVVLVGLFMPIISGPPELQNKFFFTWGEYWDGLACLDPRIWTGLVMGITDKCRWGIVLAPVILLLTYLACAEFHNIQGVARSMSMTEVSLAIGPWILTIGSLIMLISGIIAVAAPSSNAAKNGG